MKILIIIVIQTYQMTIFVSLYIELLSMHCINNKHFLLYFNDSVKKLLISESTFSLNTFGNEFTC